MNDYKLFWGDFHKHLADMEKADEIIESAKYHLDIYPVLLYPFRWRSVKGTNIETVRQRPEFLEEWETCRNAAKKHNKEGEFITFLGYEWHGNRTHFGDHNVIYYDEENPLDDSWDIETLYKNLKKRKAIAIPHHTAYMVGHRGKRWDNFDPSLSPVMEVFSAHGSSEGAGTPLNLLHNQSMGPDTSGGSFVDALELGYHIGVIGSNDGPGLPGSWPGGVGGIWAEDLTRESVWDAIKKRRTIAATGDRIALWFAINGNPPGSVIDNGENPEAVVNIRTSQPLDRVELVHNGRVAETYLHKDRWVRNKEGITKTLIEFGWGPSKGRYCFDYESLSWNGEINVENGKLLGVEPRFSGLGQSYKITGGKRCLFNLKTARESSVLPFRQGMILEMDGNEFTRIIIRESGHKFELSLRETYERMHLFPFMEESKQRVYSTFNLKEEEIENPDIYFFNARKIRVHPSYPESACKAHVSFKDLPVEKGNNYYYLRASQTDGQTAWSSPVWIKR